MSTKRLLGIFAHPDDENLISGTVLHYQTLGVETGLLFATRGEVGEISDPFISTPTNLAEVREQEMRAAAQILHVQHLWFLGYRDSGLEGSPDNLHPQAFKYARPAEVIGKIVEVIRQFRPQVIVTFDEAGGYGHSDHITIYKYVTGAFHAAADDFLYPEAGPAYSVSKLYYSADSRRQMTMMAEWLQAENEEGFFHNVDLNTLGLTEEQISVVIDVEPWRTQIAQASAQHRTHKNPNTPVSRLPEEQQKNWHRTEYFQLATSRVGEDVVGENDLFAHVR